MRMSLWIPSARGSPGRVRSSGSHHGRGSRPRPAGRPSPRSTGQKVSVSSCPPQPTASGTKSRPLLEPTRLCGRPVPGSAGREARGTPVPPPASPRTLLQHCGCWLVSSKWILIPHSPSSRLNYDRKAEVAATIFIRPFFLRTAAERLKSTFM